MDNRSNATHSSSSALALSPLNSNSSAARGAPLTPEQTLKSWTTRLKAVSSENPHAVQKLLKEVAEGVARPRDEKEAQVVFNDLIGHEAYGVFVEVFRAYNAIRMAQGRAHDEAPFKSTLALRLPSDWVPCHPDALRETMHLAQVQRIEVLLHEPDRQTYGHFFSSMAAVLQDDLVETVESLVHKEVEAPELRRTALQREEWVKDIPASMAECDCIVALLDAGATELVICGSLAAPDRVADAIARSALRSIELGADTTLFGRRLTLEMKDSYAKLIPVLSQCHTLEHLALNDMGLATLHSEMHALSQAGSALKSIKLGGLRHTLKEESNASDIVSFMEAMKEFTNLRKLSVKADVHGMKTLKACLAPIAGALCLTMLEIEESRFGSFGADGLHVYPNLLAFAKSCPSLTHVAFRGHPVKTSKHVAMALFKKQYVPDPAIDVAAIQTWLESKECPLKSLTLTGMFVYGELPVAIGNALHKNTSITHINLSDCYLNADWAVAVLNALQTNQTLQSIEWPMDLGQYYNEDKDGRIHGLSPNSWLRVAEPIAKAIVMVMPTGADETAPDFAAADLIAAPQALLEHRKRQMGQHELSVNVARILSASLNLGPLDEMRFNDVAGVLLAHMGSDAQTLREVVRLSEVAPSVNRGRRMAGQTPESVKAVVKDANQRAVRERLPTAPLMVNEVSRNGTNLELQSAARRDRADEVLKARRSGAIDFGGLAAPDASSGDVVKAFRVRMKRKATTTSTTSTTTTTTTTTTTRMSTHTVIPSDGADRSKQS
ncbi:hypothetical protein [Hydrogenophaga sp.]|uniref:hypothetical protein n=1 Tax=Hydrogenophaga sp. TaxID=1904254 RepID=UPI00271F2418|nr:hypothetical protein [Hydrogenophaga sp.]MDO9436568.1 hypothetical protein [Hydrogenophaga sp.]